MMELFEITQNSNIFLYGDNFFARELSLKMKKQGYIIAGIIDRKYKNDNKIIDGILRTDGCHLEETTIAEGVVIVCLEDGTKHNSVARKLNTIGFFKILYLPIDFNMNTYRLRKYREAYCRVRQYDFYKLEVPIYTIQNKRILKVINETTHNISFWCPERLLRTYTYKNLKKCIINRQLSNGQIMDNYAECEIGKYKPMIKLFQYLSGACGRSEIHEYLYFQRNNEEERELLLENRRELYQIYENAWEFDMDFFIDAPIQVAWNRNKEQYFNIMDGLHRLYYLRMKGIYSYPVITSYDDYERCIRYLSKQGECNHDIKSGMARNN